MGFETACIHAGQQPDPTTGAIMTPIYQTSTYVQDGVGRSRGYDYARTGNPTRTALEDCLAALEGGEFGLAFASGMAATDTVLHLLKPGDHVLSGNDVYGGTYRLFERVLKSYGLEFSYADTSSLEQVKANLRTNTRLLWLESPTNPLLQVCDIAALAEIAHNHLKECLVVVDNTFATPYLQRPLQLGADVVVHSSTKYLGGHSDVVGGAIAGRDGRLLERLAFLQNAIGAVPAPMDCFLVLRGIKTLPIRMERHAENAAAVADFLADHPKVKGVFYPFHATHPQVELARRQMKLGGGMVSFTLKDGAAEAKRVAESTRLFALAESLGGVESLIEVPAAMTHASVANSPLAVRPDLVRLSVGIESLDDLVVDLSQALG
ncbi:MAG: cystathionine gamma-synthase [Chloroflexi bacterium RBG_16_54_11]|nr:MAG: cystathionine gamma-synthase [Chloroflexi bacterium RBG_16_54_11]